MDLLAKCAARAPNRTLTAHSQACAPRRGAGPRALSVGFTLCTPGPPSPQEHGPRLRGQVAVRGAQPATRDGQGGVAVRLRVRRHRQGERARHPPQEVPLRLAAAAKSCRVRTRPCSCASCFRAPCSTLRSTQQRRLRHPPPRHIAAAHHLLPPSPSPPAFHPPRAEPVGFVQFQFLVEEGAEVLYVFELQVAGAPSQGGREEGGGEKGRRALMLLRFTSLCAQQRAAAGRGCSAFAPRAALLTSTPRCRAFSRSRPPPRRGGARQGPGPLPDALRGARREKGTPGGGAAPRQRGSCAAAAPEREHARMARSQERLCSFCISLAPGGFPPRWG